MLTPDLATGSLALAGGGHVSVEPADRRLVCVAATERSPKTVNRQEHDRIDCSVASAR